MVGDTRLGLAEMQAAQDRFTRFAPLLALLFPELAATQGRIESALLPVSALQEALGLPTEQGRLWVKADHSLPVAGSIKARGGFHEVLELTERLALQHGLLPQIAPSPALRLAPRGGASQLGAARRLLESASGGDPFKAPVTVA